MRLRRLAYELAADGGLHELRRSDAPVVMLLCRRDKGDLTRMWNLAPLMPAGRDYSRNNQGRHELIDHILVSRALLNAPEQIAVGAVIDTPMPAVNPTDPNPRRNAPVSDHAPVVATFPAIS